ncbi:MAG TPA: ABC transporter permease [Stellaceae bacterium]|nr:ABC transporter permease [Stellaceae bacterium]
MVESEIYEDGAAAALPRPSPSLMLVFWLLGSLLLALVLLPLISLIATPSLADLIKAARDSEVRNALWLSLAGAMLTALVAGIVGVPLAYLLSRSRFPGRGIVAAIVDIPMSVPHTVAGIALLMVFGRRGIIGAPAEALFGLRFWATLAGIVVAMLFVSAPYTVNAARLGFEAIDPRLEKVARTLGMGPWQVFLRITLPLAWRGVATGLTLTFARAISEFTAVAILVYYPMTAPVQIYELFLRFGLDTAAAVAVLLLVLALALFIVFRQVAYGRTAPLGPGR